MKNLRRIGATRDSYEALEFDVMDGEQYITTCVINTALLEAGISTFPCGNGDNLDLTQKQRLTALRFLQAKHKAISKRDKLKNMESWHRSGIVSWEEYCQIGDLVEQDAVDYFMNVVPPVVMKDTFRQAGEAFNYEKGEDGGWRPIYATFTKTDKNLGGKAPIWRFEGYCFKGERINRATEISRILGQIRAAEEAKKNG